MSWRILAPDEMTQGGDLWIKKEDLASRDGKYYICPGLNQTIQFLTEDYENQLVSEVIGDNAFWYICGYRPDETAEAEAIDKERRIDMNL